MATFAVKSVASGAIFGAALAASGVYSPSIIMDELYLKNFHMLKAFLAASASSAIVILLAQSLSLTGVKPRSGSSINLFSAYDGNILGGLLLGLGMTLTGACPGTALVQVATSVSSGLLVLLGGIIGGILWSGFGRNLLVRQDKAALENGKGSPATVSQQLGVSRGSGVVLFEVMCLSVIAAVVTWGPGSSDSFVPPIIGGLLIGLSQLASLLLTTNTLAVSSAYEEVGDYFWWILSAFTAGTLKPKAKPAPHDVNSTIFAIGVMLGSYALSKVVVLPANPEIVISTARAIAGGIALTIGGRLAGGCTSGHGISGMSMLSIASFITVAAMFVGGMGLAHVMG